MTLWDVLATLWTAIRLILGVGVSAFIVYMFVLVALKPPDGILFEEIRSISPWLARWITVAHNIEKPDVRITNYLTVVRDDGVIAIYKSTRPAWEDYKLHRHDGFELESTYRIEPGDRIEVRSLPHLIVMFNWIATQYGGGYYKVQTQYENGFCIVLFKASGRIEKLIELPFPNAEIQAANVAASLRAVVADRNGIASASAPEPVAEGFAL